MYGLGSEQDSLLGDYLGAESDWLSFSLTEWIFISFLFRGLVLPEGVNCVLSLQHKAGNVSFKLRRK